MLRAELPPRTNGREVGLCDPVGSPICATTAGNYRFLLMHLLVEFDLILSGADLIFAKGNRGFFRRAEFVCSWVFS